MPDVLLQDYLEEISNLIDESRLGEAVRHCRFILQQYPRHVDTYRLLGKAFLERGELQAAADVFRRVLSADPEDFIAHAGMAIIYKQEDQYKQAVWHMERAFEVDPYNAAIQEALKDLYGRRDGLPPGQLPLTRGALSRLYVKGEMYAQAIAELGELVEQEAGRVDLKVLLAEALWRDGQRVDAVEVCQAVLEELPDCIKANAILGEIWLVTGRHDEAPPYMQRVYALTLPAHDVLDDDSPVSRLFRTDGALELQEQVFVERLQESAALGMAVDDDDWVQDLELSDDQLLEQTEPEWLEVLQSEDAAARAGEVDSESFGWSDDVSGAEDSELDVSDTETADPAIANLDEGRQAAEGVTTEPPEARDDATAEPESTETRWLEPADELTGLGDAPEDADWEQWLQQESGSEPLLSTGAQESSDSEEVAMGAAEEFGKGQEDMPEDEMPEMENEQRGDAGDDSFDWLQELGDAEDNEGESLPDEVDGGELPDWLAEDSMPEGEDDDSLQWLEGIEDAEGFSDEVDDDLPDSELPDWLREEAAASEAGGEENLGWLDQIAAGQGAAIEEPPTLSWPEDEAQQPEEQQPEALAGDAVDAEPDEDVMQAEGSEVSQAADEAGPIIDPAQPGSVDDAEALDEVPEDLEDAMAWLEQLAAQQGAPVEELPSLSEWDEADEDALLGAMPDDIDDAMAWLDDLSEEATEENVLSPEAEDPLVVPPATTDEAAGGDTVSEAPADAQEPEYEEPEMELPEMGEAFEQDWLGELAEAPAQDIDETPDEAAEDSEAVMEGATTEADEEEPQEEPDWLEELGDDVEVDEAWLDELAATEESESALESAEPLDDESETAGDVPDDADEAMAWLEQLAARQGAPVDELPSFDEFGESEVDAHSMADLDDIPEDPEAALAWLEALAEGEEAAEDDGDVVEEPPTPTAPQDVVAARAEAEAILLHDEDEGEHEGAGELFEEMPEDPDEAMAWLERLAARQGAPLDELPSVTSAEDDVETPEWIAREASEAETQEEMLSDPVEEAVADDDEVEALGVDEEALAVDVDAQAPAEDVEAPDREEEAEGVDLDEAQEELTLSATPEVDDVDVEEDSTEDVESEVERALMSELVDEELEEDLPSWLVLEGEEADDLDWETADTDISSWLQAEEEATQYEMEVPSIPQTDELEAGDVEAPVEEERVQPEPVAETPEITDAEAPETGTPQWASAVEGMDTEQLGAGRRALEMGDFETALPVYRQLLEANEGLGVVVDDLETVTSRSSDQPQLWQLLGDAYMQNGQLQKALDAYRQALDQL
ncbi:MAG TPA: tetratricopeptide repeat protein [Candidatus Sulfomarinibacteraceae bacterium]|nr:tetratricopeptide repeat protein [Candidatus Sulfomarinibacteraceae bacterium]